MGPNRTILDHAGLYVTICDRMWRYRTIWNHAGQYRTIRDHTGSYRTIQDHVGLYKTRSLLCVNMWVCEFSIHRVALATKNHKVRASVENCWFSNEKLGRKQCYQQIEIIFIKCIFFFFQYIFALHNKKQLWSVIFSLCRRFKTVLFMSRCNQ